MPAVFDDQSYPPQWQEVLFDSFTTLKRGKDLTREQFNPGEIPVAGSNGVIGLHNTANVKGPGVTVGRSGSVGKVAYYDKDFWAHNTALFVSNFHGNDIRFAAYFLRHARLGRFGSGASVPTLDRNVFRQLPVFVPPICEQRKIAAVLSLVQRAIDQQDRLLALTSELKKALLQKLFTEGLDGEPQKQTEIGAIPEDWNLKPLSELVARRIVDGTHKTPTYTDSGIPFITAKDIIDSAVCFHQCRYISKDEHLSLTKRVKPQRGDVLLTKVGTVGNVALIDFDTEFSIFVQLALLRPDPTLVTPEFLYWALHTQGAQRDILSKAPQSTMKFIGTQKIATVKVPVPDIPRQIEIARILDCVQRKENLDRNQITALQDLFRTLLHQLMTARIRVNHLDLSEIEKLLDHA